MCVQLSKKCAGDCVIHCTYIRSSGDKGNEIVEVAPAISACCGLLGCTFTY